MGQQPNIETTEKEEPRDRPEPGPAVKWRSSKPGIPSSPAEAQSFGRTGPDAGWALKLVANATLPDDDPRLRAVVTGLVLARAAALGRAAVPEDIAVALVLCGYGKEVPEELLERRARWLAAVPHEKRPGELAASEVDEHLLIQGPEQIEYAFKLSDH